MKTAVHFGAGKIGRGFIADLLHDSGYKIVFADVVQPLVDLVNETHEKSKRFFRYNPNKLPCFYYNGK